MRFSFWAVISLVGVALASPVPNVDSKDLVKRNTALNSFLALLLDYLPAIDGSINSVGEILTVFENFLALLTGEPTTYNQLGGACKAYTVIFARGTTEPGNVGILVGPPFFDALRSLVGSSALTIQGVNDYSASIDGYIEGGDPAGSAEMQVYIYLYMRALLTINRAVQIEAAHKACPNTKLVASGYSQGGQIVHNAIGFLPAAVASWSMFSSASCLVPHQCRPKWASFGSFQHQFADLER